MISSPHVHTVGERKTIMCVGTLAQTALNSGIPIPPDIEDYNAEEYPHFFLFIHAQLCRTLPKDCPSAHWDNARLIAGIPTARIGQTSIADLEALGLK